MNADNETFLNAINSGFLNTETNKINHGYLNDHIIRELRKPIYEKDIGNENYITHPVNLVLIALEQVANKNIENMLYPHPAKTATPKQISSWLNTYGEGEKTLNETMLFLKDMQTELRNDLTPKERCSLEAKKYRVPMTLKNQETMIDSINHFWEGGFHSIIDYNHTPMCCKEYGSGAPFIGIHQFYAQNARSFEKLKHNAGIENDSDDKHFQYFIKEKDVINNMNLFLSNKGSKTHYPMEYNINNTKETIYYIPYFKYDTNTLGTNNYNQKLHASSKNTSIMEPEKQELVFKKNGNIKQFTTNEMARFLICCYNETEFVPCDIPNKNKLIANEILKDANFLLKCIYDGEKAINHKNPFEHTKSNSNKNDKALNEVSR